MSSTVRLLAVLAAGSSLSALAAGESPYTIVLPVGSAW
jgi:hypothetical protein